MTTADAAKRLGLKRGTVKQWITRGILPKPTYCDEHGTRFFDERWVRAAKALIQRKNGKLSYDGLVRILKETGVNHGLISEGEQLDE